MNGSRALRYLGQAAAYALFIAFIGHFSNSPPYRHLAPGLATIKLSLRHSGVLLGECRARGSEELASMPATMRTPMSCPRERSPLQLELEVNGKQVLRDEIKPRGIHSDGMASSYRRLSVPAGAITLKVRLKDHIGQQEFPYRAERKLVLRPAQVLVIDFDSEKKRFEFL